MWQNYINALLGLVVLVLAFTGLTGMALAWTLGIVGAVILILGIWGGAADSSMSENREHMHA